jgi:hypothetical protein
MRSLIPQAQARVRSFVIRTLAALSLRARSCSRLILVMAFLAGPFSSAGSLSESGFGIVNTDACGREGNLLIAAAFGPKPVTIRRGLAH